MSSNSSATPPPSSKGSSPPPSAAPPPSPDSPPPTAANSSSPAPTNSDGPSPPPAPSNSSSHGAPSGIPSPPSQSSRGSSRPSSSQASARRVGSNTTAEIIFAAAGAAALLALFVTACVCCSRRTAPRRRRRKAHDPMHLYADSSAYKGSGKSSCYTSEPQPQWQSSMSAPGLGSPGCSSWHVAPPGTNSSGTQGQPMSQPAPHEGLGKGTFTYEELAAATCDFSPRNLVGQGGFGHVHKGVLPCGKAVAVKQLRPGSGQGEREFRAEVDIIGRVHHRHLVSLVGHCVAGERRMLVYEFVPNKTLEFHLHGKGLPAMAWATRLRIALGSARGLAYLHEDCHPRIIHRDIKSANILLDNNFEATVADFGLAKLLASDSDGDGATHVSTRVMGTFGYLAPEYASSGKLTEKSDVFSYGVTLLELVTGRRPLDARRCASLPEDDGGLVGWARPAMARALAGGDFGGVADPRLPPPLEGGGGGYDAAEMARVVACAAACVRQSARKRPRMSQVVRALEGDMSLEDLNVGVRPGRSRMFDAAAESSGYTKEAPATATGS